jgi:hypothetical protein
MELLGASAAGHPSTIKAKGDGERAKGGVKLEEFGGHLGDMMRYGGFLKWGYP